MAILGTYQKQPNDVLDYDIDFSRWIADSDLIISVVATADVGITLLTTTIVNSGKSVKQWVSGGVSGVTYKIQIRATTSEGRVKEDEFKVKVKEY